MSETISVREAEGLEDIEKFWSELHTYHKRDIFPDPADEDREYFLDDSQYRSHIDARCQREHDRCHRLFFRRKGVDIGFALAVIYDSEDGKCFLMEFCVFPEYRGGTGSECAAEFLAWGRGNGAKYFELNYDTEQRRRFWERSGFRLNGRDEWGVPLMLLPPREDMPVEVRHHADSRDWQLKKLVQGFLAEIGEEAASDEALERLERAVEAKAIVFFLAYRGARAVGMCSVATHFSTFSCGKVGAFEDFYIEPAFRGKGIARMLVSAAREYCSASGIASLSVTCAECDVEMYRALGFDVKLGVGLACMI